MSFIICCPRYGVMDPEHRMCFGALRAKTGAAYIQNDLPDVAHSRTVIANTVLCQHEQVSLWLDQDILFKPRDAVALVEQCKPSTPIVAGVYARKGIGDGMCVGWRPGPPVQFGPRGGLRSVQWVGFGFVAVHRSVFEALEPSSYEIAPGIHAKPYFETRADPLTGTYPSSDKLFCLKAQRAGFVVQVDTRIILGHAGVDDKGNRRIYTYRDAVPKAA